MCLYHGGLRDALWAAGLRPQSEASRAMSGAASGGSLAGARRTALALCCTCANSGLPGGPQSQLPPAPFDKAMVIIVPLISWWYHRLCEAARARAGGAGEGGEGRSAELPDCARAGWASGDTVTAGGPSPCMARRSQLCSRGATCHGARCTRRAAGRYGEVDCMPFCSVPVVGDCG